MRYDERQLTKEEYPINGGYSPNNSNRKSMIPFERNMYSVDRANLRKKKRFNTESELVVESKDECILPKIKTKSTKLSFQQSFFTKQELNKNMKMEEIQKRLYKMRNSKIGKKILVINAYGV